MTYLQREIHPQAKGGSVVAGMSVGPRNQELRSLGWFRIDWLGDVGKASSFTP